MTATIEGLRPNSFYYYQVLVDGEPVDYDGYPLLTAPSKEMRTKFSIGFGSGAGRTKMDCRQSGSRCRMRVLMLFSGWEAMKPFPNFPQNSKRKNTDVNEAFPFCNPCCVRLRSSPPGMLPSLCHRTRSRNHSIFFNATGPILPSEPRKLPGPTLTINMAEWTSYSSTLIPIVTKLTTRPFSERFK